MTRLCQIKTPHLSSSALLQCLNNIRPPRGASFLHKDAVWEKKVKKAKIEVIISTDLNYTNIK